MAGYVHVQNLPSLVANNKEAVQQLERDCRDSEEIHGGNRVAMIANKGLPAPGKFWISGRSLHPTGNASLGYVEAQYSSSPWMRGAPQVGFSATIRKIRFRISFDSLFLPT